MTANGVVHESASKGFHNATSYDAYRPSYPAEAVRSLLEKLGLEGKTGSTVVDLAAGTGKFTELLAARPEEFDVVAVEPLDSMRETLAGKNLKGVKAVNGMGTDMAAVSSGSVDGCIIAQAFHWFANEDSLNEINRALKPGAKLGLIWNVEDYNQPTSWTSTTKFERKLNDLSMKGLKDSQPRFMHLKWQEVFERQAKSDQPFFTTPIQTSRVPWSVWLTPEGLYDRMNTLSWNVALQGKDREEFKDKFAQILKSDEVSWNDKGELEIHGCTFFAWTSKV